MTPPQTSPARFRRPPVRQICVALLLLGLAPMLPAQQVGTVRFPTSCAPAVQPGFTRAVALLHSFVFSEATAAFEAVLRGDPGCVMGWWGLALTAWGNPFAAGIKPAPALRRGLEAVQRGRALPRPSAREAGYLEAVARLYEGADSLDQPTRLGAYRDAMAALAAREPADTEAAIFQALALAVAADPGDQSYADLRAAGALFERLFARLPDHPGVAHYLIHSYDVPPLAPRALAAAARYGQIAPEVSHALHMPSHTYTRVGLWDQSIAANLASAAAARREGAVAEELHAADYRTYAYLQTGRDSAARAEVTAAPGLGARIDPAAAGTGAPPAAGYYAAAAIPARYALERGDWGAAAALPLAPSPTPFANAVTWYARGLGAARGRDSAGAAAAAAALEEIRGRLVRAGEAYWAEQVAIQHDAVAAWADYAAGRTDAALTGLRAAARREDATEKNAITPGPLAPVRELLGELALLAGRPAEALAAFEATLEKEAHRFRATAGAARAATAAGDAARARQHWAALLELGRHADPHARPELAEAARALGRAAPE